MSAIIKLQVSSIIFLFVIFMGLASVGLVLCGMRNPSYGQMVSSRLATIESLVHNRTFAIDDSLFNYTIDKAYLNGHYYSMKPPLLSTLGAGLYWIYFHLTGRSFKSNKQATYWFLTFLMGVVPHILLLIYFYRFLLFWVTDQIVLIMVFACVCFGYLGAGYATTINNHSTTASVLFIAFYYAYITRHKVFFSIWPWLISGFLAGLASTFDHPCAIFGLALFLYLATVHSRRAWGLFITAALIPVAAHFVINVGFSGSFLPLEIRRETFLYPGSYWLHPVGFDAQYDSKFIYFFHLMLGHHGFFAMTPVFFLSAISIFRAMKNHHPHYAEALAVGIPFMILIPFYIFSTHNYGGLCVGMRWLIPAMPLLFLFSGEWLGGVRSDLKMAVFIFLLIIGCFPVRDALENPWSNSQWCEWTSSTFGWDVD